MHISVGLILALSASAASSPLLNGHPNVDNANTRSDWVTKYKPGNGDFKSVDDANTRSDWVTKYKPGKAELVHWIPSGPGYMKLDYSPIHHEHLITLATGQHLYTENLDGLKRAVARFFNL